MKRFMEALATGFYSGLSPVAPGTMGTLVAVPLTWVLLQVVTPIAYMAITLVAVVASIFIAQWYESHKGEHDSQEIVIDEMVGFMIAMTWLPLSWQAFVAGFILFRLFDALKPFPINVIDQRIGGGLGVVADDVAAGLVTNFVLQIVYTQTSWLGSQWVQGPVSGLP